MPYVLPAFEGTPEYFKLRKVDGSILVHVGLPDQSSGLVCPHVASHLFHHSFYIADHHHYHLFDHCNQFIRSDGAIPVRVDQGESLNKGK